MKILLLGSNGQLVWELQCTCPAGITLTFCDFPKVDFTTKDSIEQCIQAAAPDCIINAAASLSAAGGSSLPSRAFVLFVPSWQSLAAPRA